MPEEPQNTPVKKDIYSKSEFLTLVRSKYPEYGQMDDDAALASFLGKYPVYRKNIDWGGLPQKKKVMEAYDSPEKFVSSISNSPSGSSDTLSKYRKETDLFPDIYLKAKQMEGIFNEAEQASSEKINIPDLIKSGQIVYTDENGQPCAEEGGRNYEFSWGNDWEIVEDLSGYPSHKNGGVDIKINQGNVSFTNHNRKEIVCAHGLLLPGVEKDPKKKPSFDEYYATIPQDKNDTLTYDLRAAYDELPYSVMKKFANSNSHLPDTYKKPNHPTFSNESKFHSTETPGGKWDKVDGVWYYEPSLLNIESMGGLKKYEEWFKQNEPGVELMIPQFQVSPDKQYLFEDVEK